MIEIKQLIRTLGAQDNPETGVSLIQTVDYEISQYLSRGYELVSVVPVGDVKIGSESFARVLYILRKETVETVKSAK